jgi:predicted DNA-binding transcriptional regulator YafY
MSDINDAAAQLRRVLLALPALDDDHAHSLDEVASAAGTDETTLLRDLRTLIDRSGDEPPGFVDTVSLTVDATSVRLAAPGFFRRPMGITATELHAIELGLAMLRQESPMEAQGIIDSARERDGCAIAGAAHGADGDSEYAASAGAESDERRALMKTLRDCIDKRCVADLCYQSASSPNAEWRRVRPLGFVNSRGAWYLVAFTESGDELRVFRFDRVSGIRPQTETFSVAESFTLSDVVREGRVLSTEPEEKLRIRYSPRIARWIAEREELPLDADGSVTVEMPLHDTEWAVRYVLQYGDEAEAVAPPEVRTRLKQQLGKMAPKGD